MIDFYYWATPNGHKVSIMLEEIGAEYQPFPIDIGKGQQFDPEFLRISPNNKIPAIIDHNPPESYGEQSVSVFESGCILLYLAEKSGLFLPKDPRGKTKTLEWLFWQMGGLGPMLGQNHHFSRYAPETIPYAVNRYVKETERLYQVMENRLAEEEYLVGEYSIADVASYPWIVPHKGQGMDLRDFPNLKRWFDSISNRKAVIGAYGLEEKIPRKEGFDQEEKKVLFGQCAENLKK